MPAEIIGPQEPSARALVGGIIDDVKELAERNVELARREIEIDIEQRARAVAALAVGAMIVPSGLVLLGLAAAQLLHAAAPQFLAPWAAHVVVGSAAVGAGLVPLIIGRRMLTSPAAAKAPARP